MWLWQLAEIKILYLILFVYLILFYFNIYIILSNKECF